MKTLQKMLIILVIAIFTVAIVPTTTSFAGEVGSTLDSITPNTEGAATEITNLNGVVGKILGFLQIASAVMAVIILAYTGFRYVIETPDMKSELKKTMIPIVVGVLVVFGATTIAKFIINLVGG